MLWFLALHIAAMLFWVAALVYLPVLIAGAQRKTLALTESPRHHASLARFVFTHIAGPAAITSIIAGTAVFLLNGTTSPWLIAKLTLVVLLVIIHALLAFLVMRLEVLQNASFEPRGPVQPWCTIALVVIITLIVSIFTLVLAKPDWEVTL
ncbi:CopD family protein [Marinimicrobium alkaliphilum]|uniref:CopD family protein n=1 Tax=Marinimicrobium alkaliphilum TaxID=2202654 RepID=UPI000DB9BC6B|nr:CopD family protein [Marinimicrobium alkaliphilum]